MKKNVVVLIIAVATVVKVAVDVSVTVSLAFFYVSIFESKTQFIVLLWLFVVLQCPEQQRRLKSERRDSTFDTTSWHGRGV